MIRIGSLLLSVAAFALSADATDKLNQGEALIEWVRSEGGFFSPKLRLQRISPSDPDSSIGVFATEDISEEEKLVFIPQDCVLTKTEQKDYDLCNTTRFLMEQRELGDESKYAPYVNYLFAGNYKGKVPPSFSEEGKKLLKTITGGELLDVTDSSFADECEGSGNAEEEETFLVATMHNIDDMMVPVLDMFNHRNGEWTGVKTTNNVNDKKDITAVASRDIKSGEQVYMSYNECTGCDYEHDFVLPHLMRDYGFIEDYPRRWIFDYWFDDPTEFEIDAEPDADEFEFTWFSDEPDTDQINILRGHLKRVLSLGDLVAEDVEKLSSSYEARFVTEYYSALVTALNQVIIATGLEEECDVSIEGNTCADESSQSYDELEKPGPELYTILQNDEAFQQNYKESKVLEQFQSQYQKVSFLHNERTDDTCLWLNDHVQACESLRPHYHEVLVHYPARFVDEVKRIAFIGGGDNMIVHEILKYPSLELAVGLELDHSVVRASFKHLGIQPHWDDDRLQWWYGDGAESLMMLPQDYYGTFDLVLVDLQTDVVEVVKVTEKLNIMDAALLLLKPDGVVARNEDWLFGSTKPFTKYTLDLYYLDVPVLVNQGITVGSNTVDFMKRRPKDHGVDILYSKATQELAESFDTWYNYKANKTLEHKLCSESGSAKNEVGEKASSGFGVMLVLEAEDAESLGSSSSVQSSVSKALQNAGLREISVTSSPMDEGSMYEMVFVLREGYVVARVWPESKYCAFDLLLWSSFEKQENAKIQLISAVGSKGGKSSSSYRVVTGGMFGIAKEDLEKVGPRISGLCDDSVSSARDAPPDQSAMISVLDESVSLIQDSDAQVVVVCGLESQACSSLDLLTKKFGAQDEKRTAVPIWTCPGIGGDMDNKEDASKRMWECEIDTLKHLDKLAKEGGRFGGFVIDPTMPREMAQILHKILSKKRVRMDLLADDLVVLALSQDSSESWRKSFLDRFRTDFVMFDPAYRAEMVFNSTTSSFEFGVFSSGDSEFFSHVVEMIGRVEDRTGLVSEVRNVVNGYMNYVADFEPSASFTHNDYDLTNSLEQWMSQQPLGKQRLYRLAPKPRSRSTPSAPAESEVKSAVQTALQKIDGTGEIPSGVQVVSVGDGCVVIGFLSQGSMVASWDGKTGIVVNIFSHKEGDKLLKIFPNSLGKILGMKVAGTYEWPRGINRVVNSMGHIGPRDENPSWAPKQQ